MPDRLLHHFTQVLNRCERPAHHQPEDHELLMQLVAMRLVTTRRDYSGHIIWRLTTLGEQALQSGWY